MDSIKTDCEVAEGANAILGQMFEQVWVINLKRRPERLERFWNEIENAAWPFRTPRVFEAIEGAKVGVPKFWRTGAGSYGCLRSHMCILERAIMDDVRSLLILEDDATFKESFGMEVMKFFEDLPEDWECLMLGGQHVNSLPVPVFSGVVRAGGGGGIQRTHCYALRGTEVMKALCRSWANAAVHCDWVMGPCMARFKTYAPDPFLVGQAEGKSDISGGINPAKFWRPPNGTEPVVVLHAPRDVMEKLRKMGYHAGYNRDPKTGIDVGLKKIFRKKTLPEAKRNKRLREWINTIQWEVVSMAEPGVCTVWHPEVTADMIGSLVRGRVIEVSASTVEEVLEQVPENIQECLSDVIRVVLIRAEGDVVDELRKHGWHNGYWRDPETGQDNGVRQIFAATDDWEARRLGLHKLARMLYDEASRMVDGVAMFWHPEITADMLRTDEIEVVEIEAECAGEAIKKWKKCVSNG